MPIKSSGVLKNDRTMQPLSPHTLATLSERVTCNTQNKSDDAQKVLRLAELPSYMGLSKSMISNLRRCNSPYFDPLFPQAIKLSRRAIGFFKKEIDDYLVMRQKQS